MEEVANKHILIRNALITVKRDLNTEISTYV